ncbi:MAG: type IV toxin-antitoxin system AbiEi family antitoxin domain-containing protein [Ignavibacteria bacterium]|nr:type IV toxin-antitoxin system AbiEi family antitoxin domain-containing protein [Ignavibacteria bacterium]
MIDYLAFNNGYARMKDLKERGIHPREIKKALEDGLIDKVKPGLYKLIDFPWDENSSFVDVYRSNNKAVVCLTSAIEYYGLTTFNPTRISIALPENARLNKIFYPPVKVYYFRDIVYQTGIEKISSKSGEFLIYSVEKTLADLFRYQQKIGDDIVLESLKNYMSSKNRDIALLWRVAEKCGALKRIKDYMKAFTI